MEKGRQKCKADPLENLPIQLTVIADENMLKHANPRLPGGSSKNNLKNLEQSQKRDTNFWDCVGSRNKSNSRITHDCSF